MFAVAWLYATRSDPVETILPNIGAVVAADGDSFAIGPRKLRLKGIDAPERKQTCSDENGALWDCGTASHGSLIAFLAQPGLKCEAEIQDRFNRSLATCSTNSTPDIAAAQVSAGLAVSNEFNNMRDYGAEEDGARNAKRGIWRGQFIEPKEWRSSHQRSSSKPIS